MCTSPTELTHLGEEFVQYQLLSNEDIPQSVWDEGRVEAEENEGCHYQADILWHHLSLKKHGGGHLMFPRLSKIAKLVLVIPHSNADEERVFSMVRKNKTPFRPNLSLDKSLPSLLTVKLATDEPRYKFNPPTHVVERARKVTWEYNKQHRKS